MLLRTGILRAVDSFGTLLFSSVYCWPFYNCFSSAQVRNILYHGLTYLHDILWVADWTQRALAGYVSTRPNLFYVGIYGVDDVYNL